ncbi:alpha/beta hydrolase [Chryseosolibacter indicus]|uniref:Alpha/beta hydrolase n=1 Tax=Chryseosolibacter indicus TaxID=2782351 RepID=A0ABS5VWK6_9BACT|nr:alpha/beta hydrolase [Chryseosolibacter indicus]MBT1705124.1 alpha/beta hydrolase [Chryseosolibacter indicus]
MGNNKHILFIQGAGDDGYEEDAKLVDALQGELGSVYKIHFPHLHSDENLSDFGWLKQISNEIVSIDDDVILVAHSLGASMLLKCLSENQIAEKILGIFLMATPFWEGDEEWVQGLKLKADFADELPKNVPVFLYHCRDDEEVPFDHLELYKKKMPHAIVREIESGGHQLKNDLSIVAKDIQLL